jgi:hypothetical protein
VQRRSESKHAEDAGTHRNTNTRSDTAMRCARVAWAHARRKLEGWGCRCFRAGRLWPTAVICVSAVENAADCAQRTKHMGCPSTQASSLPADFKARPCPWLSGRVKKDRERRASHHAARARKTACGVMGKGAVEPLCSAPQNEEETCEHTEGTTRVQRVLQLVHDDTSSVTRLAILFKHTPTPAHTRTPHTHRHALQDHTGCGQRSISWCSFEQCTKVAVQGSSLISKFLHARGVTQCWAEDLVAEGIPTACAASARG